MTENAISFRSLGFLVASDCEFTRDLIHFALEAFQAEDIRDAASGAGALEVLRSFAPDVLLTEMKAPGLDGPTVIRRLRAATGGSASAVAVIAFADRPTEDEILATLEAGADDVLRFPFSALLLARRITQALVRRRRAVAAKRRAATPPPRPPVRLPRWLGADDQPLRWSRNALLTPDEILALTAVDDPADTPDVDGPVARPATTVTEHWRPVDELPEWLRGAKNGLDGKADP